MTTTETKVKMSTYQDIEFGEESVQGRVETQSIKLKL